MTYFDTLFEPDDLIELRLVSTWERDGKKRSSVKSACFDRAKNFTTEAVRDVADLCGDPLRPLHVFCGVCPRAGAKGKSADIPLARSLWNDLDGIGPAEAVAIVGEQEMPPPTLVVDSGHGTHLYWRLTEAVLFTGYDDRAAFQAVVAGVGRQIGGDHTHDPARLLRLPATWNCKRLPWPRCEVQAHLSAPSARYALKDFEHYAERPDPRTCGAALVKSASARSVATPGDRQPTATWGQLTERQRQSAETAIERSAVAPPGTRSEVDFGTLSWLAKLGLSGDDAWERVCDAGKFSTDGERYFRRTWDRAAGAAAEQRDRGPATGRHASWFDEKFK